MKHSIKTSLCILLFAVTIQDHANAELIAYEGFDGGVVSGEGVEDTWTMKNNTVFARDIAYNRQGLSAFNIPVVGGSVQGGYIDNSLLFRQAIPVSDSPKFVSFFLEAKDPASKNPNKRRSQAGVIDQEKRQIVAGVRFSEGANSSYMLSSTLKGHPGVYNLAELEAGRPVFVVMKISDNGSGSVEVEVWFFGDGATVPESLSSLELPENTAYGSFVAPGVESLTGFTISSFGMRSSFDEFRLGDSYKSVVGR